MGSLRTATVAVATVLAIATAGPAQAAEQVAATPAFTQALAKHYWENAQIALAESDHPNADFYADKARMAEQGAVPEPAKIGFWHWWVPEWSEKDLIQARAQLVQALSAGYPRSHPEQMAQAQVYYDCWVEEEHEDIFLRQPGVKVYEPEAIARCRDGFFEAMKFQTAAVQPGNFVIYFDFDESHVRAEDRAVVASAADRAGQSGRAQIRILAHTDRAGSADYNMGLSKRRAQSVMDALQRQGVPRTSMNATWFGESRPAVRTGDGVREQQNRRAELIVQ